MGNAFLKKNVHINWLESDIEMIFFVAVDLTYNFFLKENIDFV